MKDIERQTESINKNIVKKEWNIRSKTIGMYEKMEIEYRKQMKNEKYKKL